MSEAEAYVDVSKAELEVAVEDDGLERRIWDRSAC